MLVFLCVSFPFLFLLAEWRGDWEIGWEGEGMLLLWGMERRDGDVLEREGVRMSYLGSDKLRRDLDKIFSGYILFQNRFFHESATMRLPIQCGLGVMISRSHRGDQGSSPCIGISLLPAERSFAFYLYDLL